MSQRLRLLAALMGCALAGVVTAHGDLDVRIARLDQAIRLSPDNAQLYFQRGELRLRHGAHRAAIGDLRKAMRLVPELPNGNLLLGQAHLAAGDFTASVGALDAHLAKQPNDARAYLHRSRALEQLGDIGAAIADLDGALRTMPRAVPEVYLRKARLLLAKGQYDAAINTIEEASHEVGGSVILIDFAVEESIRRKHYAQALLWLDRLPPKVANAGKWLSKRGDALYLSGDHANAFRIYRRALRAIPEVRRETQANRELAKHIELRLAQHGLRSTFEHPPGHEPFD